MSEIVKEKPIMEEAHKRYKNFIRSRLMRQLPACGVSEYEKKELYQYYKQISLEDKRQKGIKVGIKKCKLEGIKVGNYAIAKGMKKDRADFNLISKYTGLSIEEIYKL